MLSLISFEMLLAKTFLFFKFFDFLLEITNEVIVHLESNFYLFLKLSQSYLSLLTRTF